ncbi:hypothetical protein AVEN_114857-1 [Araneus ventricosus]|uniref:Uncharacterized protein n=1 Tax=Araneus ventricosus TaxID=182803 RepID=A0A4Y2QYY4_ARAVE|nr:hypothetical protein AVEN_114857-1 [Araneus ventricosus]
MRKSDENWRKRLKPSFTNIPFHANPYTTGHSDTLLFHSPSKLESPPPLISSAAKEPHNPSPTYQRRSHFSICAPAAQMKLLDLKTNWISKLPNEPLQFSSIFLTEDRFWHGAIGGTVVNIQPWIFKWSGYPPLRLSCRAVNA